MESVPSWISENCESICLNPNHEEGKHKARVFASTLGLLAADAEWMRDQLLKAARSEDADLISETLFGSLYMVRSGWIVRHLEDVPRLTTCYIKQR